MYGVLNGAHINFGCPVTIASEILVPCEKICLELCSNCQIIVFYYCLCNMKQLFHYFPKPLSFQFHVLFSWHVKIHVEKEKLAYYGLFSSGYHTTFSDFSQRSKFCLRIPNMILYLFHQIFAYINGSRIFFFFPYIDTLYAKSLDSINICSRQ